jgi:hypothetical protein
VGYVLRWADSRFRRKEGRLTTRAEDAQTIRSFLAEQKVMLERDEAPTVQPDRWMVVEVALMRIGSQELRKHIYAFTGGVRWYVDHVTGRMPAVEAETLLAVREKTGEELEHALRLLDRYEGGRKLKSARARSRLAWRR